MGGYDACMTDASLSSSPSLGSLLSDALAHWAHHQARFWKFTIPVAILLASVPYLMLRGWIPDVSQWVQSGVRAFVDVLILYQWFHYALHDDWSARRNRLLQQKQFPWGAFLSFGFLGFWALHFILSYGLISIWRQSGIHASFALQQAIVPIKEIVLAIVFGGFLLYLQAKVAKLPWGPSDAWRAASGVRGRLIGVAVLWAVLSLVFLRLVDELIWYVGGLGEAAMLQTERQIIELDFASSVVGIATDFFMYYLLAHVVAKLFIATTGWRPEPLPK